MRAGVPTISDKCLVQIAVYEYMVVSLLGVHKATANVHGLADQGKDKKGDEHTDKSFQLQTIVRVEHKLENKTG